MTPIPGQGKTRRNRKRLDDGCQVEVQVATQHPSQPVCRASAGMRVWVCAAAQHTGLERENQKGRDCQKHVDKRTMEKRVSKKNSVEINCRSSSCGPYISHHSTNEFLTFRPLRGKRKKRKKAVYISCVTQRLGLFPPTDPVC